MATKIKREIDKKTAELKITVPISADVWKKEQKLAFDKLAKKVKVPGFRPGKAPEKELRKRVALTNIWEEAIGKLLNVAIIDAAKEIKESDIVLHRPTYVIDKVTEEELEITYIYPVFPELKIKNYKNLKVQFKEATKKDIETDVEQQIDKMLLRGSLLLPKEGENAKVEKGDTITFDFKGFIKDKAFDGGEAEGYELLIGSNTFIPGFEDQLIGKSLGWKGNINVKFPANYYKEDFQNQDARFEIKISEIKYNDKPKLDEQFIKSLNIPNVTNKEELNKYLFSLSEKELAEKARINFMDELLIKVIDENEIPVPRVIALEEMNNLLKKFRENLKQQDISEKEYYEVTGYNEQKVKDELLTEATKTVKKSLLETFFIKDLDIKATDEDYLRQYQRMAKLYNIDGKEIQKMIKKEIIEPQIIKELMIDKLIVANNPKVKIKKEKVEIELVSEAEIKEHEEKLNHKNSIEN